MIRAGLMALMLTAAPALAMAQGMGTTRQAPTPGPTSEPSTTNTQQPPGVAGVTSDTPQSAPPASPAPATTPSGAPPDVIVSPK